MKSRLVIIALAMVLLLIHYSAAIDISAYCPDESNDCAQKKHLCKASVEYVAVMTKLCAKTCGYCKEYIKIFGKPK